ncbi:MAG: hypothetical protein V3U97_03235 [bacterium]
MEKAGKCKICGRKLSAYNYMGICNFHVVSEKDESGFVEKIDHRPDHQAMTTMNYEGALNDEAIWIGPKKL